MSYPIVYRYVDGDGAEQIGEWEGDPADALEAAVEDLAAQPLPRTSWEGAEEEYAYTAEETEPHTRWAATRTEMQSYGAAILAGRGACAYSVWCSRFGRVVE